MTIVTYHDEEIITTAVVAEALAVIQGQKWNGVGDVTSHSCQQKRCSIADAQDTRTSIRMEYEDPLISS
jgi:hypothetical protein